VSWLKFSKFSLTSIRIIIISIIIILTGLWVGHNEIIKQVKKITVLLGPKSEKEWVLETRIIYRCGHSESSQKHYRSEELLKEASISGNPGDLYIKTGDYRFSNLAKVADWCKSCKQYQFLGIKDQDVVIRRGTPEKPGPVEENTMIKVSKLPESEIKDLKKGIPFKDGKEKLQLIEGLNGLVSN
jgi:hypothetical protein